MTAAPQKLTYKSAMIDEDQARKRVPALGVWAAEQRALSMSDRAADQALLESRRRIEHFTAQEFREAGSKSVKAPAATQVAACAPGERTVRVRNEMAEALETTGTRFRKLNRKAAAKAAKAAKVRADEYSFICMDPTDLGSENFAKATHGQSGAKARTDRERFFRAVAQHKPAADSIIRDFSLPTANSADVGHELQHKSIDQISEANIRKLYDVMSAVLRNGGMEEEDSAALGRTLQNMVRDVSETVQNAFASASERAVQERQELDREMRPILGGYVAEMSQVRGGFAIPPAYGLSAGFSGGQAADAFFSSPAVLAIQAGADSVRRNLRGFPAVSRAYNVCAPGNAPLARALNEAMVAQRVSLMALSYYWHMIRREYHRQMATNQASSQTSDRFSLIPSTAVTGIMKKIMRNDANITGYVVGTDQKLDGSNYKLMTQAQIDAANTSLKSDLMIGGPVTYDELVNLLNQDEVEYLANSLEERDEEKETATLAGKTGRDPVPYAVRLTGVGQFVCGGRTLTDARAEVIALYPTTDAERTEIENMKLFQNKDSRPSPIGPLSIAFNKQSKIVTAVLVEHRVMFMELGKQRVSVGTYAGTTASATNNDPVAEAMLRSGQIVVGMLFPSLVFNMRQEVERRTRVMEDQAKFFRSPSGEIVRQSVAMLQRQFSGVPTGGPMTTEECLRLAQAKNEPEDAVRELEKLEISRLATLRMLSAEIEQIFLHGKRDEMTPAGFVDLLIEFAEARRRDLEPEDIPADFVKPLTDAIGDLAVQVSNLDFDKNFTLAPIV